MQELVGNVDPNRVERRSILAVVVLAKVSTWPALTCTMTVQSAADRVVFVLREKEEATLPGITVLSRNKPKDHVGTGFGNALNRPVAL